ncbi:MAG TPA: OmpA family protein [Bacteroidia bacterium]
MKKLLFLAINVSFSTLAFSQQKFELKPSSTIPPFTYNQIGLASGFSNGNSGTSDLFAKTGKKDFSVPNNYMGSQESADGDAYFGIITYKNDRQIDWQNIGNGGLTQGKESELKYAEYIQASLGQGLVAGKEYNVTVKVSLADNSAYATKGMGVYFSGEETKNGTANRLKVTPQISFSEVIKDKSGWTELKGKFKATGSEKFAVIGAFDEGFSAEAVGDGKGLGAGRAYYYVSAITVTEAPKPDRDKDGIPDESDKCPDVAGIEKFIGCPDSDNDGIVDSEDTCPTVAGTKAMNGCPDSDGDGIADNQDKCPNVAGLPANAGCPEVKISTKAKEVFQKAMAGIQFETGKDVIKKTSYPVLDNVVSVLKENPDWNVEIQGHTDNAGKYEANKSLSQKRAAAVEKYLTDKGVNGDKLTPVGYGPDKPIADNKTTAGKAKNRRVEFNVTYEQ